MEPNTNPDKSKSKIFVVPIIIMLFLGILIFLPAGTLNYWQGELYWAGFTLITFFIGIYFSKKDPELLARRTTRSKNDPVQKSPVLFKLYFLGFILPGVDFRFQWSHMPNALSIVSSGIAFAGYLFIVRVFRENSYASTAIKVENEQHVISTGPYSVVRHPMYSGLILISLFTPLGLGSWWALLPMLLIYPMMAHRIRTEEEVLMKSLKGYEEYRSNVRYKVIPFLW